MELSLILPIHNEAQIIRPVFTEIVKMLNNLGISYECLLVENGSKDDSWRVINQLAKSFRNTRAMRAPQGYGSAVLAGLALAKGKYVCYMPSDGQVDLSVFPQLMDAIQSQRWDLVKLRRVTRESVIRQFVSYAFALILKFVFGTSLWDINGSPRIFLREHLKSLNLQSTDSFIDAEFAIKAQRFGWRVKEIPMYNLPRLGGQSTRCWKTYLEFFKNIIRVRLVSFD